MFARIALIALLNFPAVLHAEDRQPTLPPAGSWVQYHVIQTNQSDGEFTWDVRVVFLESETIDGVAHRWIEFQGTDGEIPNQSLTATKYAISESKLLNDAKVFTDRDQGYHMAHYQKDERVVRTLQEMRETGTVFMPDMILGTSLMFLPGPRKTTKTMDSKKVVDYQAGRLVSTQSLQGTRTGESLDLFGDLENWECRYQLHLHEDIPFGFAEAEFHVDTTYPNSKNKLPDPQWIKKEVWTLHDFGSGGKSWIPEGN